MPIMSASGDGHQRNKIRKNLYYDTATGSARNGCFKFKDAVQQDNEYAYDANGNLTKDLNKGIAGISYNCLNLPGAVTFIDGNQITYTYAADGTKLRTVHGIGGAGTTTDYCTNVIYENGTAKFLLTEEGYVSLNNLRYHYCLKDHQGNVRMTIYRDETARKRRVEETNHYYPFGGVFVSTTNVQPYKYNGKEYDANKGLNWHDYGARYYDAALGRFTTADRFADKYHSLSPYQYGANNPVGNIDVNGDSIVVLNHGEGMHMAMLIQNNDNKWQYFSVNGDNVYVSGKFSGGRRFDDIAVGDFASPREFFESLYNSAGDKDDKSINSYGFNEGYIIPTTREQDTEMRNTFVKISQNEEYDFLGNNCTTTVQRAMEGVGLKTYDMKARKIPLDYGIGDSYIIVKNQRPIIPGDSFQSIIRFNPSGIYMQRMKKR